MKYYIIAGEASGDLHGSKLISALKEVDQDANFQVWGGDLMEAAGATLNKHYRCLLYTSPSPRDRTRSRMPSSA